MTALHIVFDGPPSHESGRFVECETPDGKSVNAGEWFERQNGFWELRVKQPTPHSDEDLIDMIADAIQDSVDMDWNSRVGARYVFEMLKKEGVFLEPLVTS